MTHPDPNLVARVRSSRASTAAESLRAALAAALAGSVTGAAARRWRDAWVGSGSRERRSFIGVALIVAAAIHVLLELVAGNMAGPFWLIIPIVTACVGALCVAAGGTRSARE